MGIRTHLAKKGFFENSQEVPNLKKLLDLVAVGTVADMVPLKGINRTLVKAGMETLAQEGNQGLSALYDCLIEMEKNCDMQIELDVIALCGEYCEYENLNEVLETYDTFDNIDQLRDRTIVIALDNGGLIVQAF